MKSHKTCLSISVPVISSFLTSLSILKSILLYNIHKRGHVGPKKKEKKKKKFNNKNQRLPKRRKKKFKGSPKERRKNSKAPEHTERQNSKAPRQPYGAVWVADATVYHRQATLTSTPLHWANKHEKEEKSHCIHRGRGVRSSLVFGVRSTVRDAAFSTGLMNGNHVHTQYKCLL